ncbi:cytochrome d ubiquinol oxidase subunit II [Planctomycetes bacterium K23_9]|uniref:Uncharacterized protein n=1 Tax=Stieleria marina TaxID=1930275 RepID=A0A517NMR0_9BACT|nr:hypothetical protein K239x_03600 [Planctomycetes bacterium K23_9]
MNALIKKEFGDVLRWTPLGMIGAFVAAWLIWPTQNSHSYAMEESLISQLGLAAGVIAVALGLLQSLFDTRNDSRGYLLHRPWRHSQIFWAKVIAGFMAYVLTLTPAVIATAMYLGWKGIDWLPVGAGQVIPFCCYAPFVFVLHPMVIWIANRNASWTGTRLLPAVGVVGAVLLVWAGIESLDAGQMLVGTGVLVVAIGLAVPLTLWASRHAFTSESYLPPASSAQNFCRSNVVLLAISGVVLYTTVAAFVIESLPKEARVYNQYMVALGEQDEWVQVRTTHAASNWNSMTTATRPIDGKAEFESTKQLPLSKSGTYLGTALGQDRGQWLNRFSNLGSFESDSTAGGTLTLTRDGDRILAYNYNGLQGVITPDGFSPIASKSTGGFSGKVTVLTLSRTARKNFSPNDNPVLMDDAGLYQWDASGKSVKRLLAGDFQAAGLSLGATSDASFFWTISGTTLTRYDLELRPSSEETLPFVSEIVEMTYSYQLPLISLHAAETFEVAPVRQNETVRIVRADDGRYGLVRSDNGRDSQYRMLSGDGSQSLASVDLPIPAVPISEARLGGAIPPILGFIAGVATLLGSVQVPASHWLWILALIQGLVAAVAVWWITGTRGFSQRSRIAWVVTSTMLGIGTLIGIVAIYPKLICEACPRCDQQRRVDREACEHCSQAWDAPTDDGIEIREQEPNLAPAMAEIS